MRYNVTLAAGNGDERTFNVQAKTAEEATIKAANRFVKERASERHPFDIRMVRVDTPLADAKS